MALVCLLAALSLLPCLFSAPIDLLGDPLGSAPVLPTTQQAPVLPTAEAPKAKVYWDKTLQKFVPETHRYSQSKPTAVISTMEDAMAISGAEAVESVQQSMNLIHSDEMEAKVGIPGDELCAELTSRFAEYEIPIGMLEKLLMIRNYEMISFLIDDSGSMRALWPQSPSNAASHAPSSFNPYGNAPGNMYGHPGSNSQYGPHGQPAAPSPPVSITKDKYPYTTRWEFVRAQINTILDILMYLPRPEIVISFLNNKEKPFVIKPHANPSRPDTPQEYRARAAQIINQTFQAVQPQGLTPMFGRMKETLQKYEHIPTLHYIFGDGAPSDRDSSNPDLIVTDAIKRLVVNRPNPELSPITFINCSPDIEATLWMKEVDEEGAFTAETSLYEIELKEVTMDQGTVFPYNFGVYKCCMMVGAINPYDLDALDESLPMTQFTYTNLHGVRRPLAEYQAYYMGVKLAPGFDRANKEGVPEFLSIPFIQHQFETEQLHCPFLESVQRFYQQRDQVKGIHRHPDFYKPIRSRFQSGGGSQPALGQPGVQPPLGATPSWQQTGSVSGSYGAGSWSAPATPVSGSAYQQPSAPGYMPSQSGYSGYTGSSGYLPSNGPPSNYGSSVYSTPSYGAMGSQSTAYGGSSSAAGAWSSSAPGQYGGSNPYTSGQYGAVAGQGGYGAAAPTGGYNPTQGGGYNSGQYGASAPPAPSSAPHPSSSAGGHQPSQGGPFSQWF